MAEQSEIDVFIPVYNDVDCIGRAIQSCLNQKGVDVRVLVSDNCSTDGTFELVSELAKTDSRIKVSQNSSNLGLAGNMQRVHELVSRPFYMFLCSDDFLLDLNAFGDSLKLFEKYPDVMSVYSDINFVDGKERLIATNRFKRGEVFEAEETLRESLLTTRNRFGIPLLHRTRVSAEYKYRDDLVYSNDLWHSYKVASHGVCGHIARPCIANTYTGSNLTVSLMRHAIVELRSIEASEQLNFGLFDRVRQHVNHIKTIAAKTFFFKILIPLRAMKKG